MWLYVAKSRNQKSSRDMLQVSESFVLIPAVFLCLHILGFRFYRLQDRSYIVAFDGSGRDTLLSIHYLLPVISFDGRRYLSCSINMN
jgi:hypothetical protein